jgi:hypothetical protein
MTPFVLRSRWLQLRWFALLAALPACAGGQSGDEGLTTIDDRGVVAAEADVGACEGEESADDAGVVSHFECHRASDDAGPGFDCECEGESVSSDEARCADALRQACGVEPVEEPPAATGAPAEDAPPPAEP